MSGDGDSCPFCTLDTERVLEFNEYAHAFRDGYPVAVRGNLVAIFEYRLDKMRICLHAPGGIEECLLDAEMAKHLQDSRDRHLIIFDERQCRQHFRRPVGKVQVKAAVGVDYQR